MTDTIGKPDALMALYKLLSEQKSSKPKSVRDRSSEDRAEYNREAKRKQRERQATAIANGTPEASDEAIRAALSDAAIMILATGGPGTEALQNALKIAFPGRPGVPSTVRAKAAAGTLKPKVITPARLEGKT